MTFRIDLEKAAGDVAPGPSTGLSLDKPEWPSSPVPSSFTRSATEPRGVWQRIAARAQRLVASLGTASADWTFGVYESQLDRFDPSPTSAPLETATDAEEVDVVVVEAANGTDMPTVIGSPGLSSTPTSEASVRLEEPLSPGRNHLCQRIRGRLRAFFCPRFDSVEEESNFAAHQWHQAKPQIIALAVLLILNWVLCARSDTRRG